MAISRAVLCSEAAGIRARRIQGRLNSQAVLRWLGPRAYSLGELDKLVAGNAHPTALQAQGCKKFLRRVVVDGHARNAPHDFPQNEAIVDEVILGLAARLELGG